VKFTANPPSQRSSPFGAVVAIAPGSGSGVASNGTGVRSELASGEDASEAEEREAPAIEPTRGEGTAPAPRNASASARNAQASEARGIARA